MPRAATGHCEQQAPPPPACASMLAADRRPSAGAGALRVAGHIGLLVLICGSLFFLRAGSLPLSDPDEARCALIVRDMIAKGDWLAPRLEGEAYRDKPVAFFWLAALGGKLTGSAEMGGRAVAALAGLAGVLVAYAMGRRMFGPRAGLLAGVVLATSLEFVYIARWYRMDMPFAVAMWAAIWWFWRAEDARAPDNPQADRSGWLGFFSFCALATLFKGPAGLVLPAMIVGLYLLLSGRSRRIRELLHLRGIGLYLLIVAPWYAAECIRQPGYAYEFFVRQNLERFAAKSFGHHDLPGVIYLPIVLAGLVPWAVYLPGACGRYFPRRWHLRARRPAVLLLWLAAIVPLAFFAFSRTRLVNYVLPVFPPLAVLIAALIADWVSSKRPDELMELGARALLTAVLVMPLALAGLEIYLGNMDWWVFLPLAVAGAAAWGMRSSLRRGRRGACVGWAVGAIVLMYLFLIGHTAPEAYEQMSTRSLARLIDPAAVRGAKLFYWNYVKFSFAFYTGAEQVEKLQQSRPDDLARLARLLRSEQRVYCLVYNPERMGELAGACPGGYRVLGRSGKRWLVTNGPPQQMQEEGANGTSLASGRVVEQARPREKKARN